MFNTKRWVDLCEQAYGYESCVKRGKEWDIFYANVINDVGTYIIAPPFGDFISLDPRHFPDLERFTTSLPELAASVAAVKHNETGFVIGNIIGSNIMNIVAVLGLTLLIRPISVEFSDVTTQGIFMVILTMGLLILLKYKGGVTKLCAVIFILIYVLFLYFNFQAGVETLL